MQSTIESSVATDPMALIVPKVNPNPVPEFSIITCSPPANEAKFKNMESVYQQTLAGEAFEIIRITDARSLAEGYIRGIYKARGSILIFSHDDAAPLRPFAARLRAHLRRCDIVGGAGTDRLDGPAWFTAGPPHCFGQVLNQVPGRIKMPDGTEKDQAPLLLSVYSVPSALVERVQAIDGFWMAARRDVLWPREAWFDKDTCDGFHCYDVDFSFSAARKGFNVGVACDLGLCHASSGGYGDPKWKPAADKFMAKWDGKIHDHKPHGFQFTAVTGGDVNDMLSVMDGLVERTR